MNTKALGAVVLVALAWVLWNNDLKDKKNDYWVMEG